MKQCQSKVSPIALKNQSTSLLLLTPWHNAKDCDIQVKRPTFYTQILLVNFATRFCGLDRSPLIRKSHSTITIPVPFIPCKFNLN